MDEHEEVPNHEEEEIREAEESNESVVTHEEADKDRFLQAFEKYVAALEPQEWTEEAEKAFGTEHHEKTEPRQETETCEEVKEPEEEQVREEDKKESQQAKKAKIYEPKKNTGSKVPNALQKKKALWAVPKVLRFKPLRIIFVLVLIILLLLLLMWFFGLGGGGGKPLPGSVDSPSLSLEKPPEEQTPPEIKDEPYIRRELHIHFVPSEFDAETARELTCNVSWTNAATGSRETREVSEDDMDNFLWDLEKKIRVWFKDSPRSGSQDSPIVIVHMTPFPGRGTFQRIEKIVNEIDSRIGIAQIEK